MAESISTKTSTTSFVKEENLINWNELLIKFKSVFGNDIFESWIKNINLKKEFNHYVVLTAPTRFVRDWIVSRYADKILEIIKTSKKSIERIEFVIEKIEDSSDKKKFQQDKQF